MCEVCGYERYFSIDEVKDILKENGGSDLIINENQEKDFKKLQANLKRASTVNKKLRKENKDLTRQVKDMEPAQSKLNLLQEQLYSIKRMNLRLKIWFAFSFIFILVLLMVKLKISFEIL
ncbi:hypothetical protein [uncultured Microscilla sp.]|uniref:hypothetical protein n=1 Tax=uncultured Microscilla sp. TaxID=432653 RepID=UPI00261AF169|nr:hypothetical protein [uncultured Microscilla sp.]